MALVISLSQCTVACWEFDLEAIELPFSLSGVCSPSEANYCSNPFEVFFLVWIKKRDFHSLWKLAYSTVYIFFVWKLYVHAYLSVAEPLCILPLTYEMRRRWWFRWQLFCRRTQLCNLWMKLIFHCPSLHPHDLFYDIKKTNF